MYSFYQHGLRASCLLYMYGCRIYVLKFGGSINHRCSENGTKDFLVVLLLYTKPKTTFLFFTAIVGIHPLTWILVPARYRTNLQELALRQQQSTIVNRIQPSHQMDIRDCLYSIWDNRYLFFVLSTFFKQKIW